MGPEVVLKEKYPPIEYIDPAEMIAAAVEVAKTGCKIGVFTDIDLTVSTGGKEGFDNPFQTEIIPASGEALSILESKGHRVAFITNRSGAQAARMAAATGIKRPMIIGTYGQELYQADSSYPEGGVARISDRYGVYNEPITKILKALRSELYSALGISESAGRQVEIELAASANDTVYIERKGLCDLFPEGLAQVYNFNLYKDLGGRAELVERLRDKYEQLISNALANNPIESLALKNVWGMASDSNSPRKPGRFSVSFEPSIRRGKAEGMLRLIRAQQELFGELNYGMIIYSGDNNQDAEAMWAAKIIAQQANRKPDILLPFRSYGVWVDPGKAQDKVAQQADIRVKSPDEYSEVLTKLANALSNIR